MILCWLHLNKCTQLHRGQWSSAGTSIRHPYCIFRVDRRSQVQFNSPVLIFQNDTDKGIFFDIGALFYPKNSTLRTMYAFIHMHMYVCTYIGIYGYLKKWSYQLAFFEQRSSFPYCAKLPGIKVHKYFHCLRGWKSASVVVIFLHSYCLYIHKQCEH